MYNVIGYNILEKEGLYHHSELVITAVSATTVTVTVGTATGVELLTAFKEEAEEEERDRSLCNIVKNKVISKGLPMKSSIPAAKAACMVS